MPYGGDLAAGLTNLLNEVKMPQLTIQPVTRPLRKLRLRSIPRAEIINSYHLLTMKDDGIIRVRTKKLGLELFHFWMKRLLNKAQL